MSKIVSLPDVPPADDLLRKVEGNFSTILADPPWQFQNRTGKIAPEHRRLLRYPTMELQEILDLPVAKVAAAQSHLYLWTPNALLMEGLKVRTLKPGRTQVNTLATRKREHSRKPDEIYDIIESCSPGPYLELFARFRRSGWSQWGNENVERNSIDNVAHRKGHVEPQMRLLESPKGYRGT